MVFRLLGRRNANPPETSNNASPPAAGVNHAPSGANSESLESDIKMLVDMGFTEEQAAEALSQCDLDVSQAVLLLLQGVDVAGVLQSGETQNDAGDVDEARADIDELDAALNEAIWLSDEENRERRRNIEELQTELEEEEQQLKEILEVSKAEHKMQEFQRQRQSMEEAAQVERALMESSRAQQQGDSTGESCPKGNLLAVEPRKARPSLRLEPLKQPGSVGIGIGGTMGRAGQPLTSGSFSGQQHGPPSSEAHGPSSVGANASAKMNDSHSGSTWTGGSDMSRTQSSMRPGSKESGGGGLRGASAAVSHSKRPVKDSKEAGARGTVLRHAGAAALALG